MTDKDRKQNRHAELQGSGAIAQGKGAVAASGGSVAAGRDIHGDVTIAVTYQGSQIGIPSPEAIAAHRAALREQLQADACERWGGMAVYIQEEGAALPIEASPYQTGRLGPRESLLGALHAADRLLLLGGAGCGKTVSLQRLAWELCGASEPVVPVLLRLFRYDGAPLMEWARAHLQETGILRLDDESALAAFLKEGDARCFFLFDGLNEVQPDYRDALVGELDRWMKSYPRHSVALTSRPQDELWRRLRDEVDRALVVQPIDDDQARRYLVDHLDERGEALYAQLDQRLRDMARTPLILWLIKQAAAAHESVPGNRGELYARFVSRMLRRDTDRRIDAEIPERLKRQALTGLAYYLGEREWLTCPREEAARVAARRLGEDLTEAEKVIGACARHGLLAGGSEVWFAPHQTVQEHFAALALQEIAEREWAMSPWERMKRGARRLLGGEDRGLRVLADKDWWMETFVQLAGLVDDTDRLVRDVSTVNPWLALWCAGEGRKVSQETQSLAEERSVHILHSERVRDRRRAVAALAQIHNERVIEPLLWAAGDSDVEVSSLAVQALGQLGDVVRPRAIAALGNQDLWAGVLRYAVAYRDEKIGGQLPVHALENLLGFPMVWVPPGPFLMGSDKEGAPQAFDRESPQHEVTLPGYWIGRYPVTVGQFRLFVDVSGRDADERSLKDPDDHPVRWVSFADALEYCRCLSDRTGLPVTLPSEAEWEKAAGGTDGRIYPWGDEPASANLCNYAQNVGDTTPVGTYSPAGDSPYGCADMAGNVWEWTRSQYKGYPYDPKDGRENLKAGDDVPRVVRGGSFHDSDYGVRCAFRLRDFPGYRWYDYGFRVVVAPFSPTSGL